MAEGLHVHFGVLDEGVPLEFALVDSVALVDLVGSLWPVDALCFDFGGLGRGLGWPAVVLVPDAALDALDELRVELGVFDFGHVDIEFEVVVGHG